MDTENDNEQQPIISSASSSSSSSNNSSSSNLLANLPMLPMLHSQDDDDDDGVADVNRDIDNNAVAVHDVELAEEEEQQRIPLNPPSPTPPPFLPSNNAALSSNQLQHLASTTDQPSQQQLPDNSSFISPLLFNNNSSSSSSTSSPPLPPPHHNPQHHHLYHQAHSEHPHHQQQPHSSSPPSNQPPPHQHHVPISPSYDEHEQQQQQQQQQHQNTTHDDDNAIADTIDASTVEAADDEEEEDINLNANIASTSSHHQQQQPQPLSSLLPPVGIDSTGGGSSIDAVTAAIGEQHQTQQTPPTTLPLLLQNEAKPAPSSSTHSYSSHFSHHPYHHRNYHQHYPNFGLGCGSNTYNFDINKNNNNGAIMFSNNDNNSGPSAASCSGGGGAGGIGYSGNSHQHQVTDRLKLLYPNVNENDFPLPRCWSAHDKCVFIGLSQNNLRVHYKGVGKQHNDAASVRTTYPIPAACGLYYFEVKIISKGKNGYMGIGLTTQQFRMNRLPGWDKQSYGYHGDDGNSFSSSGNGQSYGPTFTTGDVIGCCVNFVHNICFYTKNGIDLGIAFRDLPSKLYPTVGLQTPGEEVDANFGQEPFKFDQIEDMMKQMRGEMKTTIYNFPMTVEHGDPTTLLHKMVSSYLVHNGYTQTAEAFGRSTGQTFSEDLTSIRNRQKILKLVMSGKMGQAIELTLRSYPGLLENNKNLWFMLKCRQFIEMVNGSDIEYCPTNNKLTNSTTTQTQTTTPPNQTSVIQSTKSYQNGKSNAATATETIEPNATLTTTATTTETTTTTTTAANINSAVISADNHQLEQQDLKNSPPPSGENCSPSADTTSNNSKSNANIDLSNDVEMENHGHATNGNSCKNGNSNIFNNSLDVDEEMDIDVSPSTQKLSHGIERILEFGKELSQMGQQLEKDNKMNEEDRQMLEDAFSLIAYSNPWSSPLGWQLCPTKRESACTALNSAILESMNYPRRPPLDVCVAHAAELLKVMANSAIGDCAFVNIEDVFPQN